MHTRCTQAPERVACPLCRQKFSPAELAEVSTRHCRALVALHDANTSRQHRLANLLSCEVCAVHLQPSMSLQDHWRVSNLHPYCKMCDNAFRDHREWVAVSCSGDCTTERVLSIYVCVVQHTLTCSLARSTLAPGSVGGAVVSSSWTHGLVST